MDNNALKYPIGVQTFQKIREGNYVYVDKTEYVYKMTRYDYVFLSRPRRFGKSLLTSTLESYFEGRKDLFRGLALERLETEWVQHPVLHFDMSNAKHVDKAALDDMLDRQLRDYEAIYGRDEQNISFNNRLAALIENAHRQTGHKVALLIDEYDAPLLDVVHEDEQLPILRNVMRNFYSPIKSHDKYLRFVFITGITKFSQLSIFSELNNLNNISMDEEYAAICGITEEEMLTQLDAGIEALAQKKKLTKDEAVEALKDNYDGYHFTWPSPDVYNPFSLLFALSKKELGSYWFANTPTYLVEMMRRYNMTPSQFGQPMLAAQEDFDAPTENLTNIRPLLYQSGYITIKNRDEEGDTYTLGIPNREIRQGMMRSLLPNYISQREVLFSPTQAEMQQALSRDDIDGMFRALKTYLGTVPYVDNPDGSPVKYHESHWQQMLYIIFSMLGAKCDLEVRTPTGRVDLVAQTARRLYLIEVKLNQSAKAAMNQINLKDYARRFALSPLPVVKVGVNFDKKKRNITGWKIVPQE